jgi:hypothetical protein
MDAENQQRPTEPPHNRVNPTKPKRAGRKPEVYAYIREILKHGLNPPQRLVLEFNLDAKIRSDLRAGRVTYRMIAVLLWQEEGNLERLADQERNPPDEWLARFCWQMRSREGRGPTEDEEEVTQVAWKALRERYTAGYFRNLERKRAEIRTGNGQDRGSVTRAVNDVVRGRQADRDYWQERHKAWRRQLGDSFLNHPEKRENLVRDWARNMRHQDPQLDASQRAAGLKPRGRRGVPLSPPR